MPRIDIIELDKELRLGRIRPIYIIVGAEHHLAFEAMKKVKDTVCGENRDSPSLKTLSGREARLEDVISSLKTVSMFGGRPLVIVRDAESLSKDVVEALGEYAERPVESSTLVVVAEKLDGRMRFMQAALSTGALIECKPLYLDKVPAWINMQVKNFGRQISQDAARFLADLVGADLGQISMAIEKIILFVGDRRVIELKDVETAVAETHQHTVFELTDAVGKKKLPKAFSLLHNIVENGESPILILNMLARHFRILSKAKDIAGRAVEGGEIAKYLGVHPYFARDYISQAHNFSNTELKRGFRILHWCDRELKSSRMNKERIIEKALLALVK